MPPPPEVNLPELALRVAGLRQTLLEKILPNVTDAGLRQELQRMAEGMADFQTVPEEFDRFVASAKAEAEKSLASARAGVAEAEARRARLEAKVKAAAAAVPLPAPPPPPKAPEADPFPEGYRQQLERELLAHYGPKAAPPAGIREHEDSVWEMRSEAWQESPAPAKSPASPPRPAPAPPRPLSQRPAAPRTTKKSKPPSEEIGGDDVSDMFDE